MLIDSGFELVCNESGKVLSFEEQKDMIHDAFAVIAGTEKYDAAMLNGCGELRVILRFGVGTDNFDLETLHRMGVQVGVISNCSAVAEFAVMEMLCAMKHLPQLDREVRQGRWTRYPMREERGKTVGLIGFGRIGKRCAELLAPFGARLLAYDPRPDAACAQRLGVTLTGFEQVLAQSDVISLHLPATPATRHLICRDTIAMMKDGVFLVNTARGSLVDEGALYEALTNGKMAGAGLDVYEDEPVRSPDNPLFALDNVTLTPHTAAITAETNYQGGIDCAQSVLNVAQGGKPVWPLW